MQTPPSQAKPNRISNAVDVPARAVMLCIDLRIIKLSPKKLLRRREASLDYRHRSIFPVKHFFSTRAKKSKMPVSAGRQYLALAIAFKLNNANGFSDLADAKNFVEI